MRTTLSGFLLLVAVTATHAQEGGFQMPPARVEVALTEVRELAPTVEVPGTVVSLNDSSIASEVEGVLAWLADVGDTVEQGDVIARIDPRLLAIDLARAEANVARLMSDLEFRERQLERTEELASRQSASKTLLDEARAQRDQARHALADAKAWQSLASSNLERSEIRAAFSGTVTQRFASIGEYITVGEDVLRLVDTGRLEVALPAPITISGYIEPGTEVSATFGSIQKQLTVRTVVPVGDFVSRVVEVRLDAADTGWLVGTPVQVALPSNEPRSVVAVPRDALVERGGQAFVFRVGEGQTAEQIEVSIESIVGLWVDVGDRLAAGDRVIIRGAERLIPGQALDVAETLGAR